MRRMALFGKNTRRKSTAGDDAGDRHGTLGSAAGKFVATEVLYRPRITERSTALAQQNVYVFDVDPRANKSVIRAAIKELYGVTPRKVNTLPIRRKAVNARGIRGRTSAGKKAYVYLHPNDSISVT